MPMIVNLAQLTEDVVAETDPVRATTRLLEIIVVALHRLAAQDDPEQVDEFGDQLEAATPDLSVGLVRNTPLDDGTLDPEPRSRAMGAAGLRQDPDETTHPELP